MSKAKRLRVDKSKKPGPKSRSRFPDQPQGKRKPAPVASKQKVKNSTKPAPIQLSQTGLSIPFDPAHKILLVGEGDFSFSVSLLKRHGCDNIVATTFETRAKLVEKYPQSAENTSELEANNARLFYKIDATELLHPTKGGGSNLRKLAPFDRIVFNFPHTGGLTKDVNRQVRANQELCVKFLESSTKPELLSKGGRIVITLFEGEPYELWGIRNLARHAGLVVVRSTRFEWDKYPGYSHARTLGNLKGSGWKGEERNARMYIFGIPNENEPAVSKATKKRKRSDEASDEDEDENFESWNEEDEDGKLGSGDNILEDEKENSDDDPNGDVDDNFAGFDD